MKTTPINSPAFEHEKVERKVVLQIDVILPKLRMKDDISNFVRA